MWKIATSEKKDSGPVSKEFDQLVLLLGVADMNASKACYVEHGLEVARSYGRKYVEFTYLDGSPGRRPSQLPGGELPPG